VDTTVVVAEDEADGDDLGLLPVWDEASEPAATEVAPAPEPAANVASIERDGPNRVLLASGSALVAVGLALDFFWVVPAYADVEDARNNPDTVTRAEADELTASYQAARWTTLGVLGAGVAVAGSSFFVRPAWPGLTIAGVW
jgi:hypothetical protein